MSCSGAGVATDCSRCARVAARPTRPLSSASAEGVRDRASGRRAIMTEPPVRYELAHRIARVTLNRPQRRNALSAEVVEGLLAALRRAGSDDAVQVVVLTGAGEKSFCAGGERSEDRRVGKECRSRGSTYP